MGSKIAYIDADITIRVRLPFNGAPDEKSILNDLRMAECTDCDGVEVFRHNYDKDFGKSASGLTGYMECLGIQVMKTVGHGEIDEEE